LLRQQQPNLQATGGAVCAYLKGHAKTENTDRLARFVESPFVGRKLTLRSPGEPKATSHSVERDVNLSSFLRRSCTILVAENLEFDLGANPISRASVNHAPSHKVIRIDRGHFDYRGAKAAKPEF